MALERGESAPAFRLRGIDNEFWILGEPDGRRCVLLAFFRRDVPSCRILLPFVERLHRRAHAHEVEILGISLDDQRDTLEFAAGYSLTFPLLVEGKEGSTFGGYGVSEVPTLYLLGSDLKVRDLLVGWSKDGFERIARTFLETSGAHGTGIWEPLDAPPVAAVGAPIGGVGGGEGTRRA